MYHQVLSPLYADSGIQGHLEYLNSLVRFGDTVVELGTGGADQSTVAFLAAYPDTLFCIDLVEAPLMTHLRAIAEREGITLAFRNCRTIDVPVFPHDILFVDSLHSAQTAREELSHWAPLTKRLIVAHDLISFGRHGQAGLPDDGISLAFAEFLFRNRDWRVTDFRETDNGLLTLRKMTS
jgi:hypothetical protein